MTEEDIGNFLEFANPRLFMVRRDKEYCKKDMEKGKVKVVFRLGWIQ